MNILYIGPYRQKTVLGLTSQAILINLISNKKNNIACRPLKINFGVGNNGAQNINLEIEKCEENNYDVYDTVIQHAPISSCIPILAVKTNILIPIISSSDTNLNIDLLSKFTKILVDNPVDYQRLVDHKQLKNKVYVFNYHFDIPIDKNTMLNLGNLNMAKKLYYVGDFNYNKDNIQNICKSFISNVVHNNAVLLIFLIYLQNEQKEYLEQYIKNIYKSANIGSAYSKIHIMGIDSDLKTLSLIHNTCDILINADDESGNSFNEKLNQLYGKQVLYFDFNDYAFTYDRNNKFLLNGYHTIVENSINTKIKKYFQSNTVPEKRHTKKTNINELL